MEISDNSQFHKEDNISNSTPSSSSGPAITHSSSFPTSPSLTRQLSISSLASEKTLEHVAVGLKRSHNAESVISTADKGPDEKKPKLKVVMSAIRNALSKSFNGESSKIGLLAYFSKGTAEDRANFFAREDERFEQARSQSIADFPTN